MLLSYYLATPSESCARPLLRQGRCSPLQRAPQSSITPDTNAPHLSAVAGYFSALNYRLSWPVLSMLIVVKLYDLISSNVAFNSTGTRRHSPLPILE